MFARIRGASLAALLTLLAASPLAAQKVGFVNTQRVLAEMPGAEQAQNVIRERLAVLGQRQRVMADSLNGMLAAFERDSAGMDQAARTARFVAMQQMDGRYRDTLEVLERESAEMQQEVLEPLFDRIGEALEELRAAEGFVMILDLARESSQNIVAFDRNADVTDRVLRNIRARATARPAPQTPPAAATPAAPAAQRPPAAGPVAQPAGVRRP